MVKIFKSEADKIIDAYIDVFSSYSFKNLLYGKISLHVVLGQILSNKVCYRMGSRIIDPRIHMFLIKPQGSGKGSGYGFVDRLTSDLNINFQKLTESTDAGLIGTIKYNKKTNQEEIIHGLLRDADIIGMEEASVLLDFTSEFSKKNMTYMQITMNALEDSSCFVSKKLGSELIEFKPHASFVLMSYPPDNLVEKILKTGFFDRLVPIFEDVTLEDRLDTIRRMSENINISPVKQTELKQKYNDLLEKLVLINQRFGKDSSGAMKIVKIDDDIHQKMISVIEEFAMKILDVSPKAREKLEHFISRLYEILLKFAIHHAILDGRLYLDTSDVLYARLIYLPIWQNLIISLESLIVITPMERLKKHKLIRCALKEYDKQVREQNFLKDKVWVKRLSMLPALQEMWDNCSKETAHYNLQKLEKHKGEYANFRAIEKYEKDKFFETKDIGGFTYIKKIRDIDGGK